MQKLIFISGAPRSGTTWLAKLLDSSPQINAIDGEPFNPSFSEKMFGMSWPNWYHYLVKERDGILIDQLQNAFNMRWEAGDFARRVKGNFNCHGPMRAYLRIPKLFFQSLNGCEYQLIKDPIAIFSCQQIYDLYSPKMIILIKHPAAFVSSMLRVRWGFYFESLFGQKELMNDLLAEYYDEIKGYIGKSYDYDIFRKSILLWKIFSAVINKYKMNNPDWLFIRHEDMANNPELHLTHIFDYLGLQPSDVSHKNLEEYTTSNNNIENNVDVIHELRRNSKELVSIWKSRLTVQQIEEIRSSTANLWPVFYEESDWS